MILKGKFCLTWGVWMGMMAFFSGCAQKEVESPVVAEVGSRRITVDDVVNRAELTVRLPVIKTAQAAFNNLLIEKLLVLEAGDTNRLAKSEGFRAFIQGIREQAMREALYKELALKPVQVTPAEIDQTYDLSQRVYQLEFFTINNPDIHRRIEERLEANPDARQAIFEEVKSQGNWGVQTVKWRDPEHDAIHLALYTRPLSVGEVLGPIRLNEDQSIMMKVQNVQIHPVIGPEEQALRINEIQKKLTTLKAKARWEEYKSDLMRGKQILFEKEMFRKMLSLYRDLNADRLLQKPPDQDTPQTLTLSSPENLEALKDQPFFTIDGQVWTVGDFKRAVMSHPLVYTPSVRPKPFEAVFKKAIADLVVDHYLNQEAYRRRLDRSPEVKREEQMWADALIARYHLQSYLEKIQVSALQEKDPSYLGMKAVDEYVAKLAQKYRKKIRVYPEQLDRITLVRIPIVAMRPGMPYPMAVPPFPMYTSADTLIVSGR